MYVDPEYVSEYLETPYHDRLVFAMGQSLLEVIGRLTTGEGIVHVALAIHEHGDKEHCVCLIPCNGFETTGVDIKLDNDSRSIAGIIREQMQSYAKQCELQRDMDADALYPVSDAVLLYENEKESVYGMPVSPYEGIYHDNPLFHKVCEEFMNRWSNFLRTNSFEELQEFWDDSARRILGNFDFVIREAAWKVLLEQFKMDDWNAYDGENILSYLNNLASQTYEGTPCHGSLAVLKDNLGHFDMLFKIKEEEEAIFFFENSYRENRKLIEMTDDDHPLIIEGGVILGVGDVELTSSRIKFLGNGKWTLSDCDGNIIFQNNSGSIFITVSSESAEIERRMVEEFGVECDTNSIRRIVHEAAKQRHGTGIVISDHAQEEAHRLYEAGRAIAIEPVYLGNHMETVALISRIDGAFVIDGAGVCYAIGAIVDGVAVIQGTSSRGARYNSLANYAAWRQESGEKCLTVIISEDGGINIAISREESDKRWIGNG